MMKDFVTSQACTDKCPSCCCSVHLVNCTFDQTCCVPDQCINCGAFDKLCNIWSIALHTCNRVRVRVGTRVRVRVYFKVRVRSGLGLRNLPNVQHI